MWPAIGAFLAGVWAILRPVVLYTLAIVAAFAVVSFGWLLIMGMPAGQAASTVLQGGKDVVTAMTSGWGNNTQATESEQENTNDQQTETGARQRQQPQGEPTPQQVPNSTVTWYDQEQTKREQGERERISERHALVERKLDSAANHDLTLSAEGKTKTGTGIRIALWEPGVEKGESLTSTTRIYLEVAGETVIREKEMNLPGYDRTWGPPVPPDTPIKIWGETDDGRQIEAIELKTPVSGRLQIDLTLPAPTATAMAGTP